MQRIGASIEIQAPPERVWAVLTDFAHYSDWNPFIVSISGRQEIGAKLRTRIQPPGGRATTFAPTVVVFEPGRSLGWLGRLLIPGIFDGMHRFDLHPVATGTRFSQSEEFRGVLVPFFRTTLQKTSDGFRSLNQAIKVRVEAEGVDPAGPVRRSPPAG